ncbi:RagB/SusD family nutrient uptake outer membrane protein [Niabella yanshanensis]|uniref:RagB/SusD family nutrient uptake outer membrane protein n=1 Tax=Niabella yanshanensis TaxID=577386 RepID=A0ABZ0W9L6_9BACT|nr:RagB/SusD family nutrient uptake outer membrane protein [Niabella yanshanensis]WQD39364.1 RagB/SusD family nutrient uptake outer membrane protein [Niabella yanshanensis]
MSSCKRDYLDIVPDNVATIENAFANRNEAQKYLATLYSKLPQESYIYENPGLLAGDEFWTYWPITSLSRLPSTPQNIARGNQGVNDPLLSYWSGTQNGKPTFIGIRDCNIFLENVSNSDKISDLTADMRQRWIGEAQFLKAYYHFYLLRMYGPIPIIDKNLPIDATTEEVRVERQPIDEVVNYIVKLLDTAASNLPVVIQNRTTELGRITKLIALSTKARVLTTAASPLFNGNTDYRSFTTEDGTSYFSQTMDISKWERAARACKEAIEACEAAGLKLYYFNDPLVNVSSRVRKEMDIRNAIGEKWNQELIWGFTNGTGSSIQEQCMPRLDPNRLSNESNFGQLAPSFKMAELFYTKNGVPINEDKTWDFGNRLELKTAAPADSHYIQDGYVTAGLNFEREPRFYANMAFDGSLWYMQNGTFKVQAKAGQLQSRKAAFGYSITGYFTKKLVSWKYVIQDGQAHSTEQYPWPVIRLADLYLMYAECLNEWQGPGAADILLYLDRVRLRAGLPGVIESWTNFSTDPAKYLNKQGLRSIIHQETLIEFAFEGHRFWDLRRWKEAATVLNTPQYGWDIEQSDAASYYRKKLLFQQKFQAPRDYFWPLRQYDLIVNPNLIQNPGW